jgi:hypothetical protein
VWLTWIITEKEKNLSSDSEIRDALNALRRAAEMALQTAIQTETAIIIVQDGKQVRITAEELRKEQAARV